jgi:alpha-1,6-mannosyltransferase
MSGARIVRLANFVGPRSGGIRTALREWGSGYLRAGHRPVLVVPGPRYSDTETAQGRVVTVPGPRVPFAGGYRLLIRPDRLRRLLDGLEPDRLEVSDRSTLRWTGRWAHRAGVPSVMVSHERLDALLRPRALADRLNAATLSSFDQVVCTTRWAAAEFRRLGGEPAMVPLGVDLTTFHPDRYSAPLRDALARPGELLVVQCTRLSPEKRPHRGIEAIRELRARGIPAVGVLAGDGAIRRRLERRAEGLPVRFLGFVGAREAVAALLATADVVVAPGPVETFGLAALEALASGTPVVAAADGALPEVVGGAGVIVRGEAYADGVLAAHTVPREESRRRAEMFGWPASVTGMLAVHGVAPGQAGAPDPAAGAAGAAGAAAVAADAGRVAAS